MIAGHEYLEFRDGEIFVHHFYTGAVRRWRPPMNDGNEVDSVLQQQAEMPLAA